MVTKMLQKVVVLITSLSYAFSDTTFTGVNPKVTIPGLGTVVGETMLFNVTEYPQFTGEVDVYRGIQYALPPIGQLRLAKPMSYGPWAPDTEYNATFFRPPCIQTARDDKQERQSEDCLYLNVWVPKSKPINATVMVWIHGGAFVFGSGSSPGYNGVPLSVINSVIYVTMSYRLNSFGFLSLGDDVIPGNYGLFDQRMALKWTKDNIAAFGGNPDDITIFGESAGAASVGLHTISPDSWDYFTKAIMQSGSASAPWGVEYDIEKARQDVYSVANRAGCDGNYSSSQELLGCLRALPVSDLLDATTFVLIGTTTNIIPFVPVIDGDFVPDHPWTLIKNHQFKQCNILLGSNLDDGSLISARAYPGQIARRFPFSDYAFYRETLDNFIYTYHNDLILDSIDEHYVDWKIADDPDSNYFYTYMEVITDEAFACPVDSTARAYVASGNTVYMYQLTHLPSKSVWPDIPSWKGVAHAEDMQFVFGYHFIPDEEHDMTSEEQDMSIQTMKYWTNFAKTGNPNLSSRDEAEEDTPTTWKPYNTDLHYKFLHPDFLNDQALKTDSCHLWNDHLPKMVTFTAELSEVEKEWREEFARWKYEDMANWKGAFDDYKNIHSTNTCNGHC